MSWDLRDDSAGDRGAAAYEGGLVPPDCKSFSEGGSSDVISFGSGCCSGSLMFEALQEFGENLGVNSRPYALAVVRREEDTPSTHFTALGDNS